MKTVVCQINLGKSRLAGFTLYDHESMCFEETTPRDVKHLIKKKEVNGLKLDKEGNILLDSEGYNVNNLIVKSGVGNYRALKPTSGVANYEMCALTKVAYVDEGIVYEIVTSRCARLPIVEEKLRSLYSLNCLYGCWINPTNGQIRFADGVEIVDMTTDYIKEQMEKRIHEQKEKEQAQPVEQKPVEQEQPVEQEPVEQEQPVETSMPVMMDNPEQNQAERVTAADLVEKLMNAEDPQTEVQGNEEPENNSSKDTSQVSDSLDEAKNDNGITWDSFPDDVSEAKDADESVTTSEENNAETDEKDVSSNEGNNESEADKKLENKQKEEGKKTKSKSKSKKK